ncbi:MAG TPA: ATP-binding protein [Planctomycetota bacterium]|nr:ATP-binding protein [Planctomycetota bacterium]
MIELQGPGLPVRTGGRNAGEQDLLNLLPAMVFVYAPDGTLAEPQGQFIAYTGLTAAGAAGWGWLAGVHPDDGGPLRRRWQECVSSGSPFEFEFRLRRADGQHRWFLARTVPERDVRGAVLRWVGIWVDIDAQKRIERGLHSFNADLERRVEDRNGELEDAIRELEGFSYTVAHDLRAPLRAIHSFGQILQEEYRYRLDPRGQDYLARITESSRRMDLLVNDLLAYSRLSRQELALQPIDLEPVVDKVLADLSTEIQDRQADVRVERPLPVVFAHKTALPMAIYNLVSNAIKYVAPGEAPWVCIRGETSGQRGRLWVEDHGIGIAAEYQERIFRVFERLHPTEVYSGTGIGLAIVRRAAERMSGRAGVESEPGKGSRFWIELPQSTESSRGQTSRTAAR